jgi:pSer/pThr/pTyr-binding forkhead associated (FHA) protein
MGIRTLDMEIVLFALRVLLVVALYAFLGALLWVLLRERGQNASTPASAPAGRITLLSSDGAPGRQYEVRAAAWLGRDPNCLVRVDDEFASARHAQVLWRVDDGAWTIEDNLSRNGTFLNGERVTRAALSEGDVIRVGRTDFQFSTLDRRSAGAESESRTPASAES